MKTKFLLLSILCTLSFTTIAADYRTVSGNVYGSHTWSGTVYVSGILRLKADAKITVSPGTVIKMGHGKSIHTGYVLVEGDTYPDFVLKGTLDSCITITSVDDNTIGATIDGSDGDPNNQEWAIFLLAPEINISHVNMRYGGLDDLAALRITAFSSLIRNCNFSQMCNDAVGVYKNATFRDCNFNDNKLSGIATGATISDSLCFYDCSFKNNGRNALETSFAAGDVIIDGCLFENNEGCGSYITANNRSEGDDLEANCYINRSKYIDNKDEAVFISKMNINTPFVGNTVGGNGSNAFLINMLRHGKATLYNNDAIPYIFGEDDLKVSDTLIIHKGTIIKIGDSYIEGDNFSDENGCLIAKGTADEPVIFTSIADDSRGGDTNNDGAQTTPSTGDGVLIGHVNLRASYAHFYYNRVFIYGTDGATGIIKHCRFENISATALYGNVDMDSCAFVNNSTGFRSSGYPDTCDVKNCTFLNNDYGIMVSNITTIRDSHFENNGIGAYVSMSACLGKNDTDSAGNNTFTNNVEYDIYNNRKSDIYAIMNKFDGTTYDEIGDKIYDCNDDAEHGKVFYTPWVMPKSTLVFMASVNGVLGVGVDITINDTTITTGEDGKVSIILSNGEYNYFYSYNNITSDSIALTLSGDRSVKVVITQAALEQYEDASISIYQNPVTKQVCISGEQEINGVEIYNLSGRLIYGVQSHGQGCQQNISLYDMASESMVMVRVKTNKGITTQKLLLH